MTRINQAGPHDALEILEGLESVKEFRRNRRGRPPKVEVVPIDRADIAGKIRALRNRLGLTQSEFASTYNVDVTALRNWEQGRRQPERTVVAFMAAIDAAPEALATAVANSRNRGILEDA